MFGKFDARAIKRSRNQRADDKKSQDKVHHALKMGYKKSEIDKHK